MKPLVGLTLRPFELGDRRARLVLAPVEGVALLLGLMPFARELLALLGQPRGLVRGALQLRLEADDGLFLLVMLGVQRGDGVRAPAQSWPRAPVVSSARRARASRSAATRAVEILDLALGLEDAARLARVAAGHAVRAAEHVAGRGGNRQGLSPGR